MLKYLKDQNQHTAAADESMSQEQSVPLSGPQDYLTVAGHGKKLRQSTMLLCMLFAIGAGGVWFMIKKAAPVTVNAATNEDQAQIDKAIAQIENMKKEMDTQMNTIVGRFYEFSNVRQIGVTELKKNPFRREKEFGNVSTEPDMAAIASQQRAHLSAEARTQSGSLELWSITSTPRGMCCMIDEKVLYEGDSVGEMIVKSIYPKRVVLDYKGIPVELTIE